MFARSPRPLLLALAASAFAAPAWAIDGQIAAKDPLQSGLASVTAPNAPPQGCIGVWVSARWLLLPGRVHSDRRGWQSCVDTGTDLSAITVQYGGKSFHPTQLVWGPSYDYPNGPAAPAAVLLGTPEGLPVPGGATFVRPLRAEPAAGGTYTVQCYGRNANGWNQGPVTADVIAADAKWVAKPYGVHPVLSMGSYYGAMASDPWDLGAACYYHPGNLSGQPVDPRLHGLVIKADTAMGDLAIQVPFFASWVETTRKQTPPAGTVETPTTTPPPTTPTTTPPPTTPPASAALPADGSLLQGGSAAIYWMQAGKKRVIPDWETYLAMGFGNRQATRMPDDALAAVPAGAPLPSRKDGTPLQGSTATIYLMQAGAKRAVPDWETYVFMGYGSVPSNRVTDADLNAIPAGPALPSRRNGTLLQGGTAAIYLMENGSKRVIPDWNTYLAMGFGNRQATRITDADLNAIPTGAALPRR